MPEVKSQQDYQFEINPLAILDIDQGWPTTFYVIAIPPGRHAANQADTSNRERDFMVLQGLACHETVESANIYIAAHVHLGRCVPCPVSLARAREIAAEKDLDCLLMFNGVRIVDIIHLK